MLRHTTAALVIISALALPVAAAQAPPDLVIQRAGQPPRQVTAEHIATLPAITQHAAIEHADRVWTGPLLWNVLVDAGAVDPAKPADAVHLAVRVIGADGWTAAFGLAELSPQFADKPIQLADKVNGAALPGGSLRLVVPDEHRGGRSVRDVVRIDIQ